MGYFGNETRLARGDLQRPALDADASVDVCIVGAGIAGLTTAYFLARAGRNVLVLDDGPIGGGETGNTTAHLSSALDDRYYELERLHGREAAVLCAESHATAIDEIERIIQRENIVCGFRRVDGYLFLPPGEKPEVLDREVEAAQNAKVAGVRMLLHVPDVPRDLGPCLQFPRQGQFDAIDYLAGLAAAVERHGGRICTGTHVQEIQTEGAFAARTVGGQTVRAAALVAATNSPIVGGLKFDTGQAAYRTYAIAADMGEGAVPTALYWDTSQKAGDRGGPYHYVRTAQPLSASGETDENAPHTMLIVGGEDHRTGQADDGKERWARLEAWARERFNIGQVHRRWSGQVMETPDGLAYIGRLPGQEVPVFVATGDSGMGMTHGTIAGLLLTDLITGRHNRWAELYSPERGSWRAAMTFASENLNTAVQYADWLRPGAVGSVEEIPMGAGAVVRRGLKLLAVYRDPDGNLHERSAVCPHRHGVVRWNAAERSWDCPCHGSRYDAYGRVLNGPASRDLYLADEDGETAEG